MSASPDLQRMRFGIFLAPTHRVGENPTISLERDLEMIEWLDRLGFDEAWVGEHHSGGWDLISSPELFLAAAAERTRHISLGTGVISLPYHHPFMVASRITLLDHLTRGRIMLGVGPGAFVTDGQMLGIDPGRLRPMMAERLEILIRLLTEVEPISYRGEGFELRDALVQLRPYQRPHMPIVVASTQSPAGMLLAGRLGTGVLSYALFAGVRGPVDVRAQWEIAEQSAVENGQRISRDGLRIVAPVHIAESREEAAEEIRSGAVGMLTEYTVRTLGRKVSFDGPPETIVERMVESGKWIVGTPEEAIVAIDRLRERIGGFGALMIVGHDWASRQARMRSFELFARHVMPRFQGSLVGLEASQRRAERNSANMRQAADQAIEEAHRAHEQRVQQPQPR